MTFILWAWVVVSVIMLKSLPQGNPWQSVIKETKIGVSFDYKHPRMLFLALPPRRKVQKLDFQREFSMSKIIWIFLIFFHWKKEFRRTFLLKFITKIRPNFDKVAKLEKTTQDAYNWKEWLILYALLKKWVAKVLLPRLTTLMSNALRVN